MREWPPCELCHKPVTIKTGVLIVASGDLEKYEEELAEFDKKHPYDADGSRLLKLGEGEGPPARVRWMWGHSKCLPSEMYDIGAQRIDSVDKALAWTLHLMEKTWFVHTNWEASIRQLFELPDP